MVVALVAVVFTVAAHPVRTSTCNSDQDDTLSITIFEDNTADNNVNISVSDLDREFRVDLSSYSVPVSFSPSHYSNPSLHEGLTTSVALSLLGSRLC